MANMAHTQIDGSNGFTAFTQLQDKLGYSPRELGLQIGIPPRTLDRRLQTETLSELETYKAEFIALALKKAEEVFGDLEVAKHWMGSELPILEYRTPIEIAVTPTGYEKVRGVLGRILAGTF
jgi:putative toxin-antitoxin system antitoxin component (TIGR02293 family)